MSDASFSSSEKGGRQAEIEKKKSIQVLQKGHEFMKGMVGDMADLAITVTSVVRSDTSPRAQLTLKIQSGEHEETVNYQVNGAFAKRKYAVGDRLTPEEYEQLQLAGEATKALEKSFTLLHYGDHTEKMMKEKLARRGFSAEVCRLAVDYLKQSGYINEREYMKRHMTYLCERKRYGKERIRRELTKKGFSRDAFDAVFEEWSATLDYSEACRYRIIKMGGAAAFADPKMHVRNMAALVRCGFSPVEIRTVLREFEGL